MAPDSLVREEDGPDGNYPMRAKMEKMLREAQISITQAIADIDGGATFREDCWKRAEGGGGVSRVLTGGDVFEKAGVNLSVVYGTMPQEALQAATERGVDRAKGMAPGERVPFFACGLSSVMHPKNPFCPTMHFNYRYFETDGGVWWFGGGTDITPCYVDEDDMKHFHGTYKTACDKHDPEFYPRFKKWADDYFFIGHRNETRGVGGIFFDHQSHANTSLSKEQIFNFCLTLGKAFPFIYQTQMELGKDESVTEDQKKWQMLRRGRYVEFNLVHDRGTKFGLVSGGRTESILLSMPPVANWEYDFKPEKHSPEEFTINQLKKGIDWLSNGK